MTPFELDQDDLVSVLTADTGPPLLSSASMGVLTSADDKTDDQDESKSTERHEQNEQTSQLAAFSLVNNEGRVERANSETGANTLCCGDVKTDPDDKRNRKEPSSCPRATMARARTCSNSLVDWCEGNRLNEDVLSALEEQGAECFQNLLELCDDDRNGLTQALRLKYIQGKKLENALRSAAMERYEKCVLEGVTLVEYMHLKKGARGAKRECKHQLDFGAHPTPDAGLANPKSTASSDPTYSFLPTSNTSDGAKSNSNTAPLQEKKVLPRGLLMIEHKTIVLDQEKALQGNPHLHPATFVSLAKGEWANPGGGELKVVLFVGATGSGKSTTINSYVNYLYGVTFDDPYRVKLVNEGSIGRRTKASESQTDQVIGYLLETPPALGGKDSLLIIDTPGFGDTRGLARDMDTISEIKAFFSQEIAYLHAVCFVIQGNATRLDSRNRWIFDQIQSLFGKDIEGIITLLMTFSDAAEPPAMAVINDAKIEYKERFKLNNSAYVLTTNDGHDYAVNSMFWQVGQCAFEGFSKFIVGTEMKSLEETRAVLDRREQLQSGIENVRRHIDLGMKTLERVESTVVMSIQAQTLIETNKEFEYWVDSTEVVKKPKETRFNTVCQNCQWTCHEDCRVADDGDKMKCSAMNKKSGYCKHCPKKCHWSDHNNLDYYYERVTVKRKETNKQLYDRYVNASSDKSKFDQVMEGLRRDFDDTQKEVYENVQLIQAMINELQEIALKPCIYHDDEYFDIMIERERKEKQPRWEDRIVMIEEIKQRSKFCSEVRSGNYDPFAERVAKVTERAVEGKVECRIDTNLPGRKTPRRKGVAEGKIVTIDTKPPADKSTTKSKSSWFW